MKFYKCGHCGNVAAKVLDKGVPLVCCGEKMAALTPNTTDAAQEKHVPVATKNGGVLTVAVGSAAHPMEDGHHISFIYVETKSGGQRRGLAVGAQPSATFAFTDDEPVAAYAYCNLHGLWKCDL